MKHLFSSFLLFCSCVISAQTTFSPGYIVTAKGDTVYGEARAPKNELEPYIKVFFKDKKGLQKNYKPDKIRSYSVDSVRYVAMESEGEPAFYKVLVSGYITLYTMRFETIRMNQPILDDEFYFSHPKSKSLIIVKEGKFKKQIAEYMKDNPAIAETYEDDGNKFNPSKAAEVITNYNAWKATQ